MRNIILCAIVLCIVACAEAPGTNPNFQPTSSSLVDNGYLYEDIQIEGMSYRIYFQRYRTDQTGYCVFAINLTKDKLSVESLKAGLAE